jgi:hypothetical protein
MRKYFLLPIILLSFTAVSVCPLVGCGSDAKKQEHPASSEQYQCPMKCTEEIFTEPGTCPVCKMELEQVANS